MNLTIVEFKVRWIIFFIKGAVNMNLTIVEFKGVFHSYK